MARVHPWPAVALAAGLALAAAPTAPAQEAGPERSCTLRLQPTDSTESVSRKVAEDTYVTHVRNGMRWLCDPATMTADSAVQYDARRTVVMIGSVHYRDTIRDLRSRRLTYFEDNDRVLAEDSVRVRQLKTGSVLRGPRVVFHNAVRGEGRPQTVATRRPRMRIPAPGDTAGDPFRVVADTTVLLGEREAVTRGDVVVRRDALTARGGYARFRLQEGSGFLARSPSVEGEEFRLTGDTIRIGFVDSELRSVRAVGHGHLTGEEMDVRAPRVDVRVAGERVDELWAYGDSVREGPARALSADQELHGDSLHFSFEAGRLTAITAVERALAIEVSPGDTTDAGRRDSAADGAAGAAPDSAADATPSPDSVAPADSATADSAATSRSWRPSPGLRRNWIAGDTVRASFSAAARAPEDSAAAAEDTASAAGRSRTEIERLVAIGSARSFYRIPGGGAEESTREAAAGEGEDERLARNYLIGDRITVRFQSGRPLSVRGVRSIGLFLEPDEGASGGATPADTAGGEGAAGDTTATETTERGSGEAGATDSVAPDTSRSGGRPAPDGETAATHGTHRPRAATAARRGVAGPPGVTAREPRHTAPGGRYYSHGWHDL